MRGGVWQRLNHGKKISDSATIDCYCVVCWVGFQIYNSPSPGFDAHSLMAGLDYAS